MHEASADNKAFQLWYYISSVFRKELPFFFVLLNHLPSSLLYNFILTQDNKISMASKVDTLTFAMKTMVLNLGSKIDDLPPLTPLLGGFLFITLSITLLFISIIIVTFVNTARRRKIDLPGPTGWPVIGVSLNLPSRPRKILEAYRRNYGDAFKIRMGWYDWVFFNTPEGVKEVFDKQVCS